MTDEEEMREDFEAIWFPGAIYTIQGPRGSGKSTFAVQVMQLAAELGYAVYTNIMFKQPQRDESGRVVGWGPEHGIERVQTPEMRKAGGFIVKAGSFAELVYHIAEDGVLRKRQRVLLGLDESAMVTGVRGGAGSGMQTREGAMVAAFNTQIRKIGMAIAILGIGDRFLAGMYRAGESSMITGRFSRVKLAGYDLNEVVEFSTPVNTEFVQTTPVRGLARPQALLEQPDADNGPVFESFSPATFRMGNFRNGKPFDLGDFIVALSDTISERSAEAVAQFLAVNETAPVKGAQTEEPEQPELKEKLLAASARADQIREAIRNTGLGDTEIGRQFGVSKQRVHELRKELKGADGAVEV